MVMEKKKVKGGLEVQTALNWEMNEAFPGK